MTRVITFYSFKGGVGRTMALVNAAHVMARDGWRVLLVDLDLEAPGMTHFLTRKSDRRRKTAERDVVDLLLRVREDVLSAEATPTSPPDLSEYLINIALPDEWQGRTGATTPYRAGRLDLIPATLESDSADSRDYLTRIGEVDLAWIFSEQGPGHRFGERLRDFLLAARFEAPGDPLFTLRDPVLAAYDVILLDSRTGLNEIAGLCVGPVSDLIVVCTGLNAQNLAGTRYFARRVGLLDQATSKPFVVVASPVPMWHSTKSSKRIADIAKALTVPAGNIVEIPYHPSAALAEMIFVIEEPKDHITQAYEQLVPRLTAGLADEREQRRIAKRLASVSSDEASLDVITSEVAKLLSLVRLQDRPTWLRPRTIAFPTGFTMRGLPRRRGPGTISDAARLALAAGVAATRLQTDDPFRRAARLADTFEPDATADLHFRLLYYHVRILRVLPDSQQVATVVAAIGSVLSDQRDASPYYPFEAYGLLRLDAIVAGMLLHGMQCAHPALPAEGQLRALLLPALEMYGLSAIGGMRTWLRGSRISPASIVERYSTFLAYLFKPTLSPDEKHLVRNAVEDLRVPQRRASVDAGVERITPFGEERTQDTVALGMAPEIAMISALAVSLTSPTLTEILGWLQFARSTSGYSWRALVDWRHLDNLRQTPTIERFMREEDAFADAIERRIDTGVYSL